jgi:hypothetical protein
MLNSKDVVSQARDKKRENLEWILRETELHRSSGIVEPRKKRSRESVLGRAIEVVRSLILLKWPVLGQE